MNDQQRAAMQMALEALHNTSNALLFVSADGYSVSKMAADAYDDAEKAITALRKALTQPQGEWVDLTDEEIALAVGSPLDEVYLADFRAVITKFKSKNTPPSVEAAVLAERERVWTEKDWGETGEWIRQQERERCAKMCEELCGGELIADAIRSMK